MYRSFVLAAAFLLAACGGESDSSGAAPAAPGPSAAASEAPATPEERGRRYFNECAVCHTVKQGDAHRVGPNLFGIVGHEAGKQDGFAYSKALAEANIVWTEENLGAFIENPQAFLRGNRMAYAGQRDAQKRADLIAYLKTLK
ncbi:c-type cytochrome [Hyphococcus sp.]|uniref:c-type cytochrome n=1 Tax=Hyphococcus sp. TaxID=2038636 RepID=UPI003D12B9AC